MSKIQPFPGVRVLPTGYRRYLVVRKRTTIVTGDVYAKNYDEAAAFVAAGKINKLAEVSDDALPTITADPADAGGGHDIEIQPHCFD